MTSKLSKTQQAIVGAMRDGATLRVFHLSAWITKSDGERFGADVTQRTFGSLVDKGVLVYTGRTSGGTQIYKLTEAYQSKER